MHEFGSISREWDDALFESSPVALALVGPDHRFLRCNAAFCQLVGYSKAELSQRTWKSITHPDDLYGDSAGADAVQVDPDSKAYSISKRYISKNGSIVWCNIFVRAVWEEDKFRCFFVTALQCIERPSPDGRHLSAKPMTLAEWTRANPKDAALVAAVVAAFLGRDEVVAMLKSLLAK